MAIAPLAVGQEDHGGKGDQTQNTLLDVLSPRIVHSLAKLQSFGS